MKAVAPGSRPTPVELENFQLAHAEAEIPVSYGKLLYSAAPAVFFAPLCTLVSTVFCAVVKASVTSIDKDASRVLLRPELSSMYGGHILTRARNGQLIPESAIYRVTLTPEAVPSELMHQSWRGQLVLHGRWEAPAWHYIRQGVMVLVRELGF
jgi:hypothetical protein